MAILIPEVSTAFVQFHPRRGEDVTQALFVAGFPPAPYPILDEAHAPAGHMAQRGQHRECLLRQAGTADIVQRSVVHHHVSSPDPLVWTAQGDATSRPMGLDYSSRFKTC